VIKLKSLFLRQNSEYLGILIRNPALGSIIQ
jgi:hypothetical protein